MRKGVAMAEQKDGHNAACHVAGNGDGKAVAEAGGG